MRTGNAILGIFFLWMAFFFPIFSVIELAERSLLDKIPIDLRIFVFVPFGVFIALGVVSLAFGIERKQSPDDMFLLK